MAPMTIDEKSATKDTMIEGKCLLAKLQVIGEKDVTNRRMRLKLGQIHLEKTSNSRRVVTDSQLETEDETRGTTSAVLNQRSILKDAMNVLNLTLGRTLE